MKYVLLLAAALGVGLPLSAQTLVVQIEGLHNTTGAIHLGFYDSAAQWATKKSSFQRHRSKQRVRNGQVTYTITDVAPGRYAVAIVDDENDSGGMDWGLLLPKEGFGFSNYESRGISRPDFEDFAFDLVAGQTTTVVVRVRYL